MIAWSSATLQVSAPRQLENAIAGSAVQTGRYKMNVEGTIPAAFRGLKAWCAWYSPGRGTTSQRVEVDASGRFQASIVYVPPKQNRRNRTNRNSGFLLPGHKVKLNDPSSHDRILLVLSNDTSDHRSGLGIRSDDLDFRMTLPPPRSRNAPIYALLPRVGSEDQRVALRVRRTVVFELPVK